MSIFSVICLYEIINSTKSNVNLFLTISALVFCAIFPFLKEYLLSYINIIIYIYFINVIIILFKNYNKIKLEKICLILLYSIIIPFLFSSFLYIRLHYQEHASFYILLAISSASASDIAAYFVGNRFGKTKLAKDISPNKTIEGAIGGIIGSILSFLLFSYIYTTFFANNIKINIFILIIISILTSIAGIIGDLTASIIKRQYNVKDFGSIMPGHGGLLDRFDSIFFSVPTFLILLNFTNLIK